MLMYSYYQKKYSRKKKELPCDQPGKTDWWTISKEKAFINLILRGCVIHMKKITIDERELGIR